MPYYQAEFTADGKVKNRSELVDDQGRWRGPVGTSGDRETVYGSTVDVGSELGLPSYDDVANAPATAGRAVWVTGNGATTPAGVYRYDGSSYSLVAVAGVAGQTIEPGQVGTSSNPVSKTVTEGADITEKYVADLSQQNPQYVRSQEWLHAPEFSIHPAKDDSVVDGSQVSDLSNVDFVADHFIRPRDGTLSMLAEIKHDDDNDATKSQSIGHWTSPDGWTWTYDQEVLDGQADGKDYSYSWFEKVNGNWRATVTQLSGGVELHSIDPFPAGWTLEETILSSTTTYVDPQFVYWDGRWYLFVRDADAGELELWRADSDNRSLLGRSWTEHTDSPLFTTLANESPAGRAIRATNGFLLPTEDGQSDDNKRIRMHWVSELTPSAIMIDEIDTSPIFARARTAVNLTWNAKGHHHIEVLGDFWGGEPLILVDGKNQSNEWSIGVARLAGVKAMRSIINRTANQSISGDGSFEDVQFDRERANYNLNWDTSEHEWTAPRTAWYRFNVGIQWASLPEDTLIEVQLENGGSLMDNAFKARKVSNGNDFLRLDRTHHVEAGDTITVTVAQDSGSSQDITDKGTEIEIRRVPPVQ